MNDFSPGTICLCGEYWPSTGCPVPQHRAQANAAPSLSADLATAQEVIRRVAMDYGHLCDHPNTCGCSMAQAVRSAARMEATA